LNWLIVLPILIPLAAAILSPLFPPGPVLRRAHIVAMIALLTSSIFLLRHVMSEGILAVQLGNWAAPFGISLVADVLSAVMVVVTAVIALAVAVYSLYDHDPVREQFGHHMFLLLMLTGICGAFLTGDLFNLFVWFELLLIASFVLMALGGERSQMEGAIKYVVINLVASTLFLASLALLYGNAGTLNMAHLAMRLPEGDHVLTLAAAVMLLVAFGIKSAIFPLFFWLPASYHTPPHPVSAIFAGLLTKVGVYAMIRVFTLLFIDVDVTRELLLVLAGLTMVTGVLGAVAQNEIRRLLSFHIISQIGYMVMGLAILTPLAIAGAIFYIVHHIIVKTNLFLIAGVVQRISGDSDLRNLGGLYRSRPALALVFLVPALSLAGMPPLSGFFAKLTLVRAAVEASHPTLLIVALAVGLLTLFSMMKIWNEAFWKTPPVDERREHDPTPPPWVAIGGLAAITVAIGLFPGPLFEIATEASRQLMNPSEYVLAVMGESP
jgi:multicomponent Na+:H+ antiporter subunit D